MSAKPDVVGEIGPDDKVSMRVEVMDRIAVRLSDQEQEIASLKRQREHLAASNAVLQERVNEEQLKASHAIALSKFSEAQMYRRIIAVEKDLNDLRNWIQGNAVQRDQEYENLRSNVSYLMGSVQP